LLHTCTHHGRRVPPCVAGVELLPLPLDGDALLTCSTTSRPAHTIWIQPFGGPPPRRRRARVASVGCGAAQQPRPSLSGGEPASSSSRRRTTVEHTLRVREAAARPTGARTRAHSPRRPIFKCSEPLSEVLQVSAPTTRRSSVGALGSTDRAHRHHRRTRSRVCGCVPCSGRPNGRPIAPARARAGRSEHPDSACARCRPLCAEPKCASEPR
jgi:hypothetical protein